MPYVGNFLRAKGLDCTILRSEPVTSKISIKRSTHSSRDLGSREAYWEGLILADSNLQSGEILVINADMYLVQSSNSDPASREYAFFATKCNTVIRHRRYAKTVDDSNNVIQTWQTLNDNTPSYIEVVTQQLRQFDPGLLEQTRYIAQVPKSLSAVMLDRIEFDNGKYQIVSIDAVGMKGVSRLQLGIDTRP